MASGHWRNAEGWGTSFSGLFSLWSQDLKETHRTRHFKAIREAYPRPKEAVCEAPGILSPNHPPKIHPPTPKFSYPYQRSDGLFLAYVTPVHKF